MIKDSLINCVIIDDDLASIKIIEALVKRLPFLDLKASFDNPVAAAHYLSSEETELIFLDVEMPGITGLELISTFMKNQCVIVISSKRDYAFDAFSLNVVDYLEKPILDYSRFLTAVLKAQSVLSKRLATHVGVNLFVKVDSIFHNVIMDDILWIEAFGDYVKITVGDKVMTTLATMKSMEKRLPTLQFVRVHKSFVVNIKKIKQIELNSLQIENKIIPVSAFYRDSLMKKLQVL